MLETHPTIERIRALGEADGTAYGDAMAAVLAPDVRFRPPTYWKTWHGREPVAALLGHVKDVFEDFRYRRVMGAGADWAMEFVCRVPAENGALDAVGVDLVTLDENGLVQEFEVVMRPHKSVGALREAMNARVTGDARFRAFAERMG